MAIDVHNLPPGVLRLVKTYYPQAESEIREWSAEEFLEKWLHAKIGYRQSITGGEVMRVVEALGAPDWGDE